jgi:hypothetical protein
MPNRPDANSSNAGGNGTGETLMLASLKSSFLASEPKLNFVPDCPANVNKLVMFDKLAIKPLSMLNLMVSPVSISVKIAERIFTPALNVRFNTSRMPVPSTIGLSPGVLITPKPPVVRGGGVTIGLVADTLPTSAVAVTVIPDPTVGLKVKDGAPVRDPPPAVGKFASVKLNVIGVACALPTARAAKAADATTRDANFFIVLPPIWLQIASIKVPSPMESSTESNLVRKNLL